MNDYQEYRSYGSYLSRVFAIIIAFLLLVFAIWGVVRLANDDDTLGDTTAPSFSDDSGDNVAATDGDANDADDADDPDLFVSGDADTNTQVVVSQSDSDAAQDAQGQTLSTNTDIAQAESAQDTVAVAGATSTDGDLPSTGAGDFALVLGLGAVSFVGSKLYFETQK